MHPENPRYFLFRGRPLTLIAATEHYGSVLNWAFDFERYLAEAADKHQTVSRTFLLYREIASPSNPASPCKPAAADYVSPWPRTGPQNALDGLPRFDLDHWNPEYFERLHRFLSRASDLGIVIELTLFSNSYGDAVWRSIRCGPRTICRRSARFPGTNTTRCTMRPAGRQLAYVRKILQETSGYDNVYYEICNEPGGNASPHASVADVDAWQPDRRLCAK